MSVVHGFMEHRKRTGAPWQFTLMVVADVRSQDYDGWRWRVLDGITQIAEWLVHHLPCEHKAIDDQCGIPEHRFCTWCFEPMPNAEVKR